MDSGYYTSGGRKAADFFIGFLAIPVPIVFIAFLGVPGICLAALAAIACPIVFFKMGRKFLAIGMLCAVAVPLLALGACLALISPMSFH